jgi:hypothetical protein
MPTQSILQPFHDIQLLRAPLAFQAGALPNS